MSDLHKSAKMSFSIEELSKSSRSSTQTDAVVYRLNPLEEDSCAYSPNKNELFGIQMTSTPLEPLLAKHNNIQEPQLKRKRFGYSDDSLDSSSSSSNSDESENNEQVTKKSRTIFTNSQLVELEIYYSNNKYLLIEDRPVLSKKLKLGQHQIKWWFQNRRMKEKREIKKYSGTFDKTQFVGIGKPCPRPTFINKPQPPHQPGYVYYPQYPALYNTMLPYIYEYGHVSPVMYPGYTQQS